MATNFQGWLDAWRGWGATDQNAASGTASLSFHATGTLTGVGATNEMQGSASMSIFATGNFSALGNAESHAPFDFGMGFTVPRYRLQIKQKRRGKQQRDNDMLFLSH